jgi:8-oxo-dGTP pyrophosphatase MutT (NUDIX family)
MSNKNLDSFEKFIISQGAILIRDNRCLILKAASREEPFWVLPGGRLDKGEIKEGAFARELKEELGFEEVKVLGIVDYDIWYHDIPKLGIKNWPVCAIVNLIEDTGQEIKFSSEHNDFFWVREEDLEKYNFIWPNAKRMIKNGFAYHRLLNK